MKVTRNKIIDFEINNTTWSIYEVGANEMKIHDCAGALRIDLI